MRSLILLSALAAATPVLAQEQDRADGPAIVVTGNPLSETAKRLEACLARRCPPNEDMVASIAHAENQFLAGDYRASRETLRRAHDRNARYAREYPLEVSDLERAFGRLTNMNGFPERGRILQIDALDTLKDGLGSTDARVLMQRLMTGDEYAQQGRVDAANGVYEGVEKRARKAGLMAVVGQAMLRQASMYSTASIKNQSLRSIAWKKIERLERSSEPELAGFRTAASVLRARFAAVTGDETEMERVISQLSGKGGEQPVLVYAPPLVRNAGETGTIRKNIAGTSRKSIESEPEWVDIRYRIDARGKVQDIETVRQSRDLSGNWANQVRAALAQRRYLPPDLKRAPEGLIRIERFTYVFDIGSKSTGSRIPARALMGRVTSLDLTVDAPQGSKAQ